MASKRRYSRKKSINEINITPLVDVMMVLLVVFMVTAPLLTTGLAINLPKVGGKNIEGNDTSLNISVDKEGYFYIGEDQVPANKIVKKVLAVMANNPEISIVISGDMNASYGRVIGLMAKLKNAGIEKVGLKTDPEVVSK